MRAACPCGRKTPWQPWQPLRSRLTMALSIIRTSTGVVQITLEFRVPRPSSRPVSPKKSPGPSLVISVGFSPARALACTLASPCVTM